LWGELPDGIGAAALSFSETAELESLQEDVRLCSAWKVAGGKRLLLVQADQALACIVAAHALSQAEFLSVLVDDFENMTAQMSQGLPDGLQGRPLAGSVLLEPACPWMLWLNPLKERWGLLLDCLKFFSLLCTLAKSP
jgi:hypothetical protein